MDFPMKVKEPGHQYVPHIPHNIDIGFSGKQARYLCRRDRVLFEYTVWSSAPARIIRGIDLTWRSNIALEQLCDLFLKR